VFSAVDAKGTPQSSVLRSTSKPLPDPVPPMVVWDFFSGCGGTSAGFRQAGMTIALGVDNDREAGATFRRNFPEATFLEKDIREVAAPLLDHLREAFGEASLVLAACAPCQPFSKHNRGSRLGDDRIPLLKQLYRFIRRFKPDYIFVENVPGMQHGCAEGGPFKDFVTFLRRHRYGLDFKVVQALNYGVPQNRQRLILTAGLNGSPSMPPPSHGEGRLPYVTVGEVIGHYPPLRAGEADPLVPNHQACSLSPLLLQRLRATPEGGGRFDWPPHLRLQCHDKHDGHFDVYGRLRMNRPSVTLTTRCIGLSNGRFGHPTQDRALSAREAAALQTFDDSFLFEGGMNSVARQIGNAVSVRLARTFGEHFIAHRRTVLGS
jgi:DNA (cytosine-5)-methyltransferase 1